MDVRKASISHRLCVSLDEYDVVAFGSSGRTAETVRYHIVRLGNAGISPLHCEICRLQDTSIALKVKPNAMVCINGVRVMHSQHRLKAGDLLLLGLSSLFAVHDGKICQTDFRYAKK